MFNCSGGREAREYIRQKLFADKQQSFPTIPFSLLPSLSSLFLHPSFPQHISFPLFSPTFLFSLYLFLSLFLSVFSLFLSIPGSVFPLCLGFFFFFCLFVCFLYTSSCSIHLLSSFSATSDGSATRLSTKVGQKGRPGLLLCLSKAQGLMAGANRETTNLLRKGKCHAGLSQPLGELFSNVSEKGGEVK